jgi:hypothetical protein
VLESLQKTTDVDVALDEATDPADIHCFAITSSRCSLDLRNSLLSVGKQYCTLLYAVKSRTAFIREGDREVKTDYIWTREAIKATS